MNLSVRCFPAVDVAVVDGVRGAQLCLTVIYFYFSIK